MITRSRHRRTPLYAEEPTIDLPRSPTMTKKIDLSTKGTKSDDITVIVYESKALPKPSRSKFTSDTMLEGGKSWMGGLIERRAKVSPETLQNNLTAFLGLMEKAISGIPQLLGGYALEEIELSLEVGAEGEIGLLGTGGKLSGKGSISLKLKRSPVEPQKTNR